MLIDVIEYEEGVALVNTTNGVYIVTEHDVSFPSPKVG